MRLTLVISAVVLMTRLAAAQEPFDYVSKLDYFSINMPAPPKVEETTYPDEYRLAPLPARVYTADQGRNHYKVTVVDYRDVAKMHAARNAQCGIGIGHRDFIEKVFISQSSYGFPLIMMGTRSHT